MIRCQALTASILAAALAVATAVRAQPSAAPFAASYRSAFADYRSYSEQSVLSWRESNELVGRIGGWQSYAREVQSGVAAGGSASPVPQAASAAQEKSAPAAAPGSGSSGGHTGHSKP